MSQCKALIVQEFSSDMNSRPVKRIEDVVRLRTAQFAEDSGPIAHPIRPESYIKMDNFYTVTVYEKGAEIIRVYETLLGKEGFRLASALTGTAVQATVAQQLLLSLLQDLLCIQECVLLLVVAMQFLAPCMR